MTSYELLSCFKPSRHGFVVLCATQRCALESTGWNRTSTYVSYSHRNSTGLRVYHLFDSIEFQIFNISLSEGAAAGSLASATSTFARRMASGQSPTSRTCSPTTLAPTPAPPSSRMTSPPPPRSPSSASRRSCPRRTTSSTTPPGVLRPTPQRLDELYLWILYFQTLDFLKVIDCRPCLLPLCWYCSDSYTTCVCTHARVPSPLQACLLYTSPSPRD